MSLQEVVEEPCVFKPSRTHDDRHCRCFKGEETCYRGEERGHKGEEPRDLLDNIEPVTLQKDTYYSRVTNEYTHQRQVRAASRPLKKGFTTLRQEALQSKRLYRDPEFTANDYAINFKGVTRKSYEWKRPMELVQNPQFFIDGATRFDIMQGELGDCWLLAAVSNLTLHPHLFHVVVPRDQGFAYLYAGIFHFKFWQYGRWQEVVVDDLLPTYQGRLVFMHSRTHNEFWCALLEKAYAKLYGCYEALRGGNINESMVDLTGGVVELIDLRTPPPNLFPRLLKACRRGALIGCAIEPDHPGIRPESVLSNGLIVRHAYSITRVTAILLGAAPKLKGEAHLLRLHNPWGNETEWLGSWSDKSPEWSAVPPSERHRLGLTFDDDGEFWMSFQDFMRNFTTVEICDVSPDFDTEDNSNSPEVTRDVERGWKVVMYEGAWVLNHTAGGCRNYIDTFATNPQYFIQLIDPDEEDDDDLCTVIISLMQKNVRQLMKYGVEYVPIGFTIYKLPPNRQPGVKLDTDFFRYHASVAKVPFFLNTRDVTTRFRLAPGYYVVVPSTFEPRVTGEFLLRVFTEVRQ